MTGVQTCALPICFPVTIAMVSGSLSLPSPGFFSPFPHGTSALSVALTYLALDRGRPSFRQGFSCPVVLKKYITWTVPFRVRDFHPLRRHFPVDFRYRTIFSNHAACYAPDPHTSYNPQDATVHTLHASGLGSSPFARRYSGNLMLISVPPGTEMVQFPGSRCRTLSIHVRLTDS